jgi:hypothetical protein
MVRDGKGAKDRMTVLPAALVTPLRAHLAYLHGKFQEERRRSEPGVVLPYALARKTPAAITRTRKSCSARFNWRFARRA